MGIGKAPSIRAADTDVTPVKKKSPDAQEPMAQEPLNESQLHRAGTKAEPIYLLKHGYMQTPKHRY